MRYIQFNYNDETIRGMIQGDSRRIIIMAHGFTGSRGDHHRFGFLLGNLYESYGFSVIRFDFLGAGESSGDQSYYTPESEINQLKFVVDQLKDNYDEIYLYGFSYGGVIASHVANDYQDIVDGLILLNPAGNMPEVIDDVVSISIRHDGGYDNNGFYFKDHVLDDIRSFNPFDGLENFKKRVFLMQGNADVVVSQESFETFKKTFPNVKSYVLEDCDHCFTSVVRTEEMMNAMRDVMGEIA